MKNTSGLPPLFTCEDCGMEINPKERGTWKKVTGWVENSKGGGAHAVALPTAPMGWMCKTCMMLKKLKAPPQTETLF